MSVTVAIQNGQYGTLYHNKKTNTTTFTPCGRAATLSRIMQSVESNNYTFELTYDYGNTKKTHRISRGELEDKTACKALANVGLDIRHKMLDVFAESIYIQETTYLAKNAPDYGYEYLGWIQTPLFNANGSFEWCYRASKIITATRADIGQYLGNFKIKPMGRPDVWLDMVKKEVLPNTPMAIVLLVALSSVILPLLVSKYPVGNGIVHLCAVSNAGKSTAGYLAASISGEPFLSSKKEPDENNVLVSRISLLQNYSATENALLGKLAGFNGVPIILDELGKYRGKNLRELIFDIFDGNGKSRMSKDLKVGELPGFTGTVISMGETSILDKASAKLEGLHNRVFEIKTKLTTSPENSKTIKKVCMANNGKIAPRLAKYILDNGCVDMVSEKYEKWVDKLSNELPSVKFVDKFIENFPAVYLTTAEIAKDALGLEFNIDAIIQFFVEYLSDDENSMDVSSKSYDYLIQEFASNSNHFYQIAGSNDIETSGEIWGRYYHIGSAQYNKHNKKILGEYAVRENILKKLLAKEDYTLTQCASSWKELDLINDEENHNYRRRKVDVAKKEKEKVYVFYVFEDGETTKNNEVRENVSKARRAQLLDPTDDCEDS